MPRGKPRLPSPLAAKVKKFEQRHHPALSMSKTAGCTPEQKAAWVTEGCWRAASGMMWSSTRVHLAQVVVEGLAEEHMAPFLCEDCLVLHVRDTNGKAFNTVHPHEVSPATHRALKYLHHEILFVLANHASRE